MKQIKKLKRDKVVSMTDKGDLVGVYFEDEPDNVLEMSPEKADKVIEAYNNEKETCNNCGEKFDTLITFKDKNGKVLNFCHDCAN